MVGSELRNPHFPPQKPTRETTMPKNIQDMLHNLMSSLPGGGAAADSGDERNPRIIGAGTVDGGEYDSLTVAGAGRVNGSVTARRIELSGSALLQGDVRAEDLRAAGSATIEGKVTVDDFTASGSPTVQGPVHAGRVEVSGLLRSGSDVRCDTFSAKGGLLIDGTLAAEAAIEIELNGTAETEALEAPHVRVRIGREAASATVRIKSRREGTVVLGNEMIRNASSSPKSLGEQAENAPTPLRLRTGRIRGEVVELESVEAETVEGGTVRVGPGCSIRSVRYRNELSVDDDASVDASEKI